MASWNPALRPNSEDDTATHNESTFEESPATIEDNSVPSLPVDSKTSMELGWDAQGADEGQQSEPEDAFFVRHGGHLSYDAGSNPLISRATGLEPTDEALIESSVELKEHPENTTTSDLIHAPPVAESAPLETDPAQTNGLEENYEPQGETTVMEDATQESAALPLVDDFNSKLDWGTADSTFGLDNGPDTTSLTAQEEAKEPELEWAGANDEFDLGVKDVAQVEQESLADLTLNQSSADQKTSGAGIDEWGTSDDQDLDFGISAATTQSPEQTTGSVDAKNGDVDALWQAAFDDEDFGTTADQSAFLFDDDEGFLDDEGQPLQTEVPGANGAVQPATQSSNRYAPAGAQAVQPPSNQYAPKEPQFTDFSQLNPKTTPRPVAPAYGAVYGQSAYVQPQRPVVTSSAQSFVDKSKGGYASPYDLPTDIVQPKKRVSSSRVGVPLSQPTPPPPRSSSMNSTGSIGPPRHVAPPSNLSAAGLSPPSSSGSGKPVAQPAVRAASNDFFAELPATSKPRPSGRYTPQPTVFPQAAHPPQPPHGAPVPHPAHQQPPQVPTIHGSIPSQLRQPERMSLYSDVSQSSALAPSVPPAAKRYSPAPMATAPSQTRYSPAPPSVPTAPAAPHAPMPPPQAPASAPLPSKYSPGSSAPVPIPSAHHQNRYAVDPASHPRSQSQSFQPRTSSPLAHHTMSQNEQAPPPSTSFSNSISKTTTPPPPRTASFSVTSSPRKTSNYAPQYQSNQSAPDMSFVPPRRSQTSSPGSLVKSPTHLTMTTSDRPSSMQGPAVPASSVQSGQNITARLPLRPGFFAESNFVAPNDERASDPLERWKGHPIFKWGLGGTVVTCFPKQNPRYGTGNAMPAIYCTPGEVKLQSIKEIAPVPESISKFPGPLKGKGKKKDVLTWLKTQIESLEKDYQTTAFNGTTSDELRKRDEKILLWKILHLFIEHDGKLEGSTAVDDAVRQVLSPGTESSSTGEPVVSGSHAAVQSEPIDPQAFDILRSHLSKGDREKAAWHAVDNRLWGHAMLLSSTLSKDIWKQVIQEFVRQEVKKVGDNNQAIAALYEVFAGNWEDSIDQLVPVSARAGFQMINTTEPLGATKNALEGLDKWRETLLLVLSNRSDGDAQALISLARLLSGYGRTDAAHICCLFARSVAYIGGADDQQTDLVLLGANHKGSQDIAHDLDAIVLTEVYEYGLSLSSTPHGLPHLQPYKLAHAYALAEYGHRNNAISYCDSIAATVKSSTRSSPYYNGTFLTRLDDLTKRLSQAPKDGSSSWISKPSMDKVSGSLLAKFNSFVSGDDSDAASNHSGNGADIGPFSRIAGSTPQISPTQSSADLYGQYRGNGSLISPTSVTSPQPIPNANGSRYAPGGAYAPISSEQPRSRYEPQTAGSYSSTFSPQESSFGAGSYMPTQNASSYTPQVEASVTSQPQYSPQMVQQPHGQMYGQSPYSTGSYQPTPPSEGNLGASFQTNTLSLDQPSPSLDAPTNNETVSSGYEPPSMGSYEPPTYQPYQPEPDSPEDAPKGKKKSFMDDDDDDEIAARAAALKKQQRAQADKEAEENFRRAAEADAKASSSQGGDKKGWFGGWFKKDPNAAPGPIKAKLGEENSFYYDPELKKWVNKKGGSSAATPAAPTPPPPKGPPSRNVSGGSVPPMSSSSTSLPLRPPTSTPNFAPPSGPPSGPPSRVGTPASVHSADGTGLGLMAPPLLPPTSNGPMSGPPSRPGTGMSNASSIDDLLGAPQARKGGTVKKNKRGGRYIDVMGQK